MGEKADVLDRLRRWAALKSGDHMPADLAPAFGWQPVLNEVLNDAIAEIERLHPAEWRPIETAPKDGTEVLLWEPSYSRGVAQIGHWWDQQTVINGVVTDTRAEWLLGNMMFGYGKKPQPTHWMPLPSPPSQS